ncbi:hypothetical protein ACTMTJ_17045 [Phytohabitans sp. LJ34]|uniref:hypothetical protein n=1 Tax=Phytohabitans sp. LJ34 TaxID=3452217 RepID=UPI003F88EF17
MSSTKRRGLLRSLVTSLVLLAGVLAPVGPAQAAWGTTVPVTIQVVGYFNGYTLNLGRAEGSVQFDDGGSAFRYSFTFCRQSSYQLPYMRISANVTYSGGQRHATPLATVHASYTGSSTTQPCYSSVGTAAGESSYPNFYNLELQLFGSTFVGQSHVEFMEDQTLYNPY